MHFPFPTLLTLAKATSSLRFISSSVSAKCFEESSPVWEPVVVLFRLRPASSFPSLSFIVPWLEDELFKPFCSPKKLIRSSIFNVRSVQQLDPIPPVKYFCYDNELDSMIQKLSLNHCDFPLGIIFGTVHSTPKNGGFTFNSALQVTCPGIVPGHQVWTRP